MTSSNELTDQQIFALTQEIKSSEAKQRPLVGENESMQALLREYADGSQVFTRKINWLIAERFITIRRLRGDGDCFYRAFAYALISTIVKQGNVQCEQLLQRFAMIDATIHAFADPEIVADFADPLKQLLNSTPLPDQDMLVRLFNDEEFSNSTVVYFRLLTSGQLRIDADDYLPFLFAYEEDARVMDADTGMPSMAQFCSHYVEATGRDADHIMIQALSKALAVNMQVAYLDQSKGEESGPAGRDGTTSVDLISFDSGAFDLAKQVLLLRPGHFDILSR